MPSKIEPSKQLYEFLNGAYANFNQNLFENRLPNCVIVLHRNKGAAGYFWQDAWSERREGQYGPFQRTHEIALNPDCFRTQTTTEIMQTLVHEMCHLEQAIYGNPSRTGYHNAEWAAMMEAVGLIPSDTGLPGGKRTGQRMSDYPAPGGRFERECQIYVDVLEFKVPWQAETDERPNAASKRASKTKYICPECNSKAWAKPETKLICGECEVPLLC